MFSDKLHVFAVDDEFDGRFSEVLHLEINQRRAIDAYEHGKVVDPTSKPAIGNIVRQQKTSKPLSEKKNSLKS